MKKKEKDYSKPLDLIKCECGYYNKRKNVERYGTCRGCARTLNKRAKYRYEMYCRLKLWRR